jgi:hypothetical protein
VAAEAVLGRDATSFLLASAENVIRFEMSAFHPKRATRTVPMSWDASAGLGSGVVGSVQMGAQGRSPGPCSTGGRGGVRTVV